MPCATVPQLLDGVVDLGAQALSIARSSGRSSCSPASVRWRPQGHEALLRAVVQVALDAPPLRVAGLEDPRA